MSLAHLEIKLPLVACFNNMVQRYLKKFKYLFTIPMWALGHVVLRQLCLWRLLTVELSKSIHKFYSSWDDAGCCDRLHTFFVSKFCSSRSQALVTNLKNARNCLKSMNLWLNTEFWRNAAKRQKMFCYWNKFLLTEIDLKSWMRPSTTLKQLRRKKNNL